MVLQTQHLALQDLIALLKELKIKMFVLIVNQPIITINMDKLIAGKNALKVIMAYKEEQIASFFVYLAL